jgi:sugar/nucleoside kinase (ribokinase family)
VNHEERGRVLQAMDGCSYKAAAGGSLSNSLVALARLGSRPIGGPALNVAMVGSVGSDPLGGFYWSGAVSTTHTCFIDFLFRSK